MVRKFPPFRSERKKMSTSEGTPQFTNGISGKLPFHLTLNRNYRIFSPNGKHGMLSITDDTKRVILFIWVFCSVLHNQVIAKNHYEKMAEYIRHFRVLCWTNMVIIKLKNKIWDWYDNIWFCGSSEGI